MYSWICALDGLLVELKTVSDRCDVEYEKTIEELKAGISPTLSVQKRC